MIVTKNSLHKNSESKLMHVSSCGNFEATLH